MPASRSSSVFPPPPHLHATTQEHLTTSDVPVTVIYGDRDSVVPSVLSAHVADHAPSLAERVVLANADHNDPVMFGSRVAAAVARLAHSVG